MRKAMLSVGAMLMCSIAFAYNENPLSISDGQIRYNTDTAKLEYSNDAGGSWAEIGSGGTGGNATWQNATGMGISSIGANFASSSTLTNGTRAQVFCPSGFTVTNVTMSTYGTYGSVSIGVRVANRTSPENLTSITGSSTPTVTNSTLYTDDNLSSWNTTIPSNSFVDFIINGSVSNVTAVSICLGGHK